MFLGNGLSINVWPDFAYGKLLDQVQGSDLSDEEAQLFRNTANFERVLADLSTAIRISALYGIDVPELNESYRNIQLTLGNAIRRVHPNRTGIPEDIFRAIREELLQYDWIFTTSYDMLLYWAMGYGGRFLPLKDHFRHGSRCEFDPDRAEVDVGEIPLYYLHGALHLVVSGDGTTWKRKQTTFETILDQFGQPVKGDRQARPLFVTEGSSEDKLRVIEGNVYLSHALERLREREGPVVVFGSSLRRCFER